MNFVFNCLKGIAIGSGAILPGISSGVLCVVFGIYEKLLDSILYFFKDMKNNFKFLFPIFIGIAIGILTFSNLLNYLLVAFPIQTKSIFIGLILGTIPSLIKTVNSKCEVKPFSFIFSFVSFAIGIFFVYMENYLSPDFVITNFNFYYLVFAGFLMSVGVVVPGVSSTIILMLMGVYSTYLSSVASLNLAILFPIGIGLIFGCLFFMVVTKFLLKHFYCQTFFSIIGFTLGSVVVILPETNSISSLFIAFLCCILGFLISFT